MSSSKGNLPPLRRRVMSHTERERFTDQMEQNKREMGGHIEGEENVGPKARQVLEDQSDKQYLKERQQRLGRALKAGSAGPLTGSERARAEKSEKELRGWLSSKMVPKDATMLRPGSSNFNKAKNMMVKNELGNPEFQQKASEWKNIQRALRPEDPDAANLENIRPQ